MKYSVLVEQQTKSFMSLSNVIMVDAKDEKDAREKATKQALAEKTYWEITGANVLMVKKI